MSAGKVWATVNGEWFEVGTSDGPVFEDVEIDANQTVILPMLAYSGTLTFTRVGTSKQRRQENNLDEFFGRPERQRRARIRHMTQQYHARKRGWKPS